MSFLADIGKSLARGAVVSLFSRVAATSDPKASDLENMAQAVIMMEAIGQRLGTKGPDKLTAVEPMVMAVVMSSGLMAGMEVVDQERVKTGVRKMTSGLADILNGVRRKDEKSSNPIE